MPTIGVLALQGGFREHGAHLRECGIDPVYIRDPDELDQCVGLIIPGGESSCLRRLMAANHLDDAIANAVKSGKFYVWGTCAGAILAAAQVVGEQPCLAIIDACIERNVFGSQLDSFTEDVVVPAVSDAPQHLVYIRAPGITKVWGTTRILHTAHDTIAAAENDRVVITSFHPELAQTLDFHRYFIKKCGLTPKSERHSPWDRMSWMRNS